MAFSVDIYTWVQNYSKVHDLPLYHYHISDCISVQWYIVFESPIWTYGVNGVIHNMVMLVVREGGGCGYKLP